MDYLQNYQYLNFNQFKLIFFYKFLNMRTIVDGDEKYIINIKKTNFSNIKKFFEFNPELKKLDIKIFTPNIFDLELISIIKKYDNPKKNHDYNADHIPILDILGAKEVRINSSYKDFPLMITFKDYLFSSETLKDVEKIPYNLRDKIWKLIVDESPLNSILNFKKVDTLEIRCKFSTIQTSQFATNIKHISVANNHKAPLFLPYFVNIETLNCTNSSCIGLARPFRNYLKKLDLTNNENAPRYISGYKKLETLICDYSPCIGIKKGDEALNTLKKLSLVGCKNAPLYLEGYKLKTLNCSESSCVGFADGDSGKKTLKKFILKNHDGIPFSISEYDSLEYLDCENSLCLGAKDKKVKTYIKSERIRKKISPTQLNYPLIITGTTPKQIEINNKITLADPEDMFDEYL